MIQKCYLLVQTCSWVRVIELNANHPSSFCACDPFVVCIQYCRRFSSDFSFCSSHIMIMIWYHFMHFFWRFRACFLHKFTDIDEILWSTCNIKLIQISSSHKLNISTLCKNQSFFYNFIREYYFKQSSFSEVSPRIWFVAVRDARIWIWSDPNHDPNQHVQSTTISSPLHFIIFRACNIKILTE